jgi:3-isopropylmalate/(R)-2-methylmalate dehydratase small subunit
MIKTISGRLHKLKNNIELNTVVDDKFEVNKDDILITGKNFGGGRLSELSAEDVLSSNLRCLIVSSINRRTFRYLINIGIPVVISPKAYSQFRGGEKVEINLAEGKIISKKTTVNFNPFSEEVLGIIESGGLIPYTKININR